MIGSLAPLLRGQFRDSLTHCVSLQCVDGVVETQALVVWQHAIFLPQTPAGLTSSAEPGLDVGVHLVVQPAVVPEHKDRNRMESK